MENFRKANLPDDDKTMKKALELQKIFSQPDDELVPMLAEIKQRRAEVGKAARNVGKKESIDSTQVITKGARHPQTHSGAFSKGAAASQVTDGQKKTRVRGGEDAVDFRSLRK